MNVNMSVSFNMVEREVERGPMLFAQTNVLFYVIKRS